MCVFVCLSLLRYRERDVVWQRFLHQRTEIFLATCTNCMMSSIQEGELGCALFAFLSGLNDVQRTTPRPSLAMHDSLGDFIYITVKPFVNGNLYQSVR